MATKTTIKTPTFKSDRAARIAYGKAERAWETARSAKNSARYECIKDGVPEDFAEQMAPHEAAEAAAYDKMVAVYEAAKAQGIWISSYHLGHNPTRDLIAMNMD